MVQRAPGEDRVYRVPYGNQELDFMLQPWFDLDVLASASMSPIPDVATAARDALSRPRGSAPLRDLAREAAAAAGTRPARAVIAVADLSRACPDEALVRALLADLNAGGIADAQITVIVAIGLHRATTDDERRAKLGAVVDRVRVIDSDWRDPAKWTDLGPIPPYGVPGSTQTIVRDADLVVATGIVEPHQYAGWSGGGETVAIGCAGGPWITATHGLKLLEDPGVRLAKIDGNPFHQTVAEIARRAGLRFCLDIVTDDRDRVVAIESGAPDEVLRALVAVGERLYTRSIDRQYDIVIAGVGKPKDVNLYRASRAATYLRFAPTPVVREGGAIIIPAQLDEGAGEGPEEQREPRAVLVALTLQHCMVIVAASEAPEAVRLAKMRAAVDVEEALDIAYEHIGRPTRASVLLVPNALHTLPIVRSAAPS